jgi:hypothetical protein
MWFAGLHDIMSGHIWTLSISKRGIIPLNAGPVVGTLTAGIAKRCEQRPLSTAPAATKYRGT